MKFPFNVGDQVIIDDEKGFITFIDTLYFTLCVRQWEDKDKLHGVGQVNVLIYRKDWDRVKKI
ncbi:MAG: hypothetical protein VYE26_04320 [Pseudomonadota bacterium]|nr:hypothetical protein [Pseudomonadota bacterium]